MNNHIEAIAREITPMLSERSHVITGAINDKWYFNPDVTMWSSG